MSLDEHSDRLPVERLDGSQMKCLVALAFGGASLSGGLAFLILGHGPLTLCLSSCSLRRRPLSIGELPLASALSR